MANTRSAMKRARSSQRRRRRNQIIRTRVKTLVRQARTYIEAGDLERAQVAVGDALSALDRAANKGVIHKNNAARRKSRLMKRYNAAFSAKSA